jgi:hypothetical protein
LPDLAADPTNKIPAVLRTQARVLLAGLNVLWNRGAATPFAIGSPSAAQQRVHDLALGRSAC